MSAVEKRAELPSGGPLGFGSQYLWRASTDVIDMAMMAPPPVPVTIKCAPQDVTVDLRRTAIIIIDMQNDFCAKGGWVDHLGADYTPNRAPIAPLQRLLPVLRKASVPVIWVNWGNRPDLANMPPNQIHLYKPHGAGIGLGDPLPGSGARVLEQRLLGRGGGRRTQTGAPRHQGRQVPHQRLLGHAARQHPTQSRNEVDLVRRGEYRSVCLAFPDRCELPWLRLHPPR